MIIPKNQSGSKTLELIITDPVEGFHLVCSKEGRNNVIYMRDITPLNNSNNVRAEPFGKISFFAMNAK
jgi:hypothetical protein